MRGGARGAQADEGQVGGLGQEAWPLPSIPCASALPDVVSETVRRRLQSVVWRGEWNHKPLNRTVAFI